MIGTDVFNEYFNGDIAEVIVFDRTLTGAERAAVQAWLHIRYGVPLLPETLPLAAPENLAAYVLSPTQISLSWTGDPGVTYIIERKTGEGEFAQIATVATGHAYIDTALIASQTYMYRVKGMLGAAQSGYGDPVTVTTAATGSDFPVAHLRTWLKTDAGVVTSGQAVSRWLDQSGSGNHASQVDLGRQPLVVDGQLNGHAVIRFNDNACLALPNLLAGATEGEIIAVVKVADKATGAYSNHNNELWDFGRVTGYYKPTAEDTTYFHYNGFGLDGSVDESGVPVSTVSNYHIHDISSSAALWQERYNGSVYQSATGQAVAFGEAPVLGAGFVGDFAELLIFDRTLSVLEREAVQKWLNERYLLITLPQEPSGLGAQLITQTQVTLTWSGSAALSYRIERKNENGSYQVIALINGLGYTDGGLTPGTNYAYRIQSVSNGITSGYTAVLSVKTSPVDIYNGNAPRLIPLTPNGEIDGDGSIAVIALSVLNNPVFKVKVKFTATDGAHLLSALPDGRAVKEIEVQTDSAGIARVYVRQY